MKMKMKIKTKQIKVMEQINYKKNDQVIISGDPSNNNKGSYKGYYATVLNHNKFDETYIVNIDTSGNKFKVNKRCLQPLTPKSAFRVP
jgi:hypothetical protein